MVKKTTNEPMVLPKMNVQTIEIPIEGISPLISHRRSEKQSAAILDKQMKKANSQASLLLKTRKATLGCECSLCIPKSPLRLA